MALPLSPASPFFHCPAFFSAAFSRSSSPSPPTRGEGNGRWTRSGARPGGLLPTRISVANSSGQRRTSMGRPPRQRLPRGRLSRRRLGGWLNRNRRLIAALLLCTAAGVTVEQLTPAPADSVIAFAAATDLPAGRTVARGDLSRISVPPGLVPAGSPDSERGFEGKQLAAPLRKGQLVTDAQVLGPGLLAGSPPGSVAVPLRMADPASVQLVSPGQLVNVVLTGGTGFEQPGESQLLAEAVPVLWTSAQGGNSGPWLAGTDTDGLIVVAAAADQARRLAGSSTQGKLFFVLVAALPG